MKLILIFLLAVPLCGQFAPVPSTAYPALETTLNAKPAVTNGTGAPTSGCTTAKDLYLDTAASKWYFCSATNTWTAWPIGFTLGTTGQYFRGDLSLATFPTIPTVTGSAILKGSSGNAVAAGYADIFALFTGCSGTQYPGFDGACHSAAGSGTVSSVGLTMPAWFTVGSSPVTTSGTIGVTAATGQTSHQVIGTCGAATTFGPCALVAADIPALNQNTTGNAATATSATGLNGVQLSTLATGLYKWTAGVPSAATAGTDYLAPDSSGGITLGAGSTNSGFSYWAGATSGGSGFAVPNVAGASALYLLPSAAGSSTQVLQNGPSTTCPTLPSDAPAGVTCYQTSWVNSAGTAQSSRVTLVAVNETTTFPYTDANSGTVVSNTSGAISISSIPQTYRNLYLQISVMSAVGNNFYGCTVNSDTASHYLLSFMQEINGNAFSFQSNALNTIWLCGFAGNSGAYGDSESRLASYARTDGYKPILATLFGTAAMFTYSSGVGDERVWGQWQQNSAITSIQMNPGTVPTKYSIALIGEQ